MDFQTQCMVQQGYSRLTRAELESIKWGLRFTPTVCMLGSACGLLMLNPYILFGLAVLGIVPFWFPDKHPLDLLYNYNRVVAPLIGATRLPPKLRAILVAMEFDITKRGCRCCA